jgi:hypothetical protein
VELLLSARASQARVLRQLSVRYEWMQQLPTGSVCFLLTSSRAKHSRMSDPLYCAMMQRPQSLVFQCSAAIAAPRAIDCGRSQLLDFPRNLTLLSWVPAVSHGLESLEAALLIFYCTFLSIFFTPSHNNATTAKKTHTCIFGLSSHSTAACASGWPPCRLPLSPALTRRTIRISHPVRTT